MNIKPLPLLLGAVLGLVAIAATVKISDLPISTSPSANSYIEIADLNAATKSVRLSLTYLQPASANLTNWASISTNALGSAGLWAANGSGEISPTDTNRPVRVPFLTVDGTLNADTIEVTGPTASTFAYWGSDKTLTNAPYAPLRSDVDTVTGNLGVSTHSASASYIDLNQAYSYESVSGAKTISYATNGSASTFKTAMRVFYNASGSDQTLSLPIEWTTNLYSPIPTKLTNGWITRMIVDAAGATSDSYAQTNCTVKFEFCKAYVPPTVTFDASSAIAQVADRSAITNTITVGSGDNRLLVVLVGFHNGSPALSVSGVTAGGVAMTKLGASSYEWMNGQEMWYLTNPTSGSLTVIATLDGSSTYRSLSAISFSGVNQTTPMDGFQAANGSSTGSTLTVTSEQGDLAVNGIFQYGGDPTYTEGAGQTTRYSYTTTGDVNVYGSTEPGAASTAMSCSFDATTAIVHLAANINHQ